ncbi:pyruvate kinase 1-like [Teleopsis dalmanni]|uniref:pyruvate kinase 1-like n=1 Tax=Teleopsis dalmanni TaxID=139649 RepID=UPI0018CEC061|nr:pyruvate kinase 1-like [Teleopsis dalmanni]XP_037940111.1 pyruvate kinase 1-like [Teleopsis dalmanni]
MDNKVAEDGDDIDIVEGACKTIKCTDVEKKTEKTRINYEPFYNRELYSLTESDSLKEEEDQSEFYDEEFEFETESTYSECSLTFYQDTWQGYFKGYEILSRVITCKTGFEKSCVELSLCDTKEDLFHYTHAGIRCFIIDLSKGTSQANQKLLLRLHEVELEISSQFNSPVITTLVARISPRMQYTGFICPLDAEIILNKDDTVILTTNRKYSTKCTRNIIYVNARFLLGDVEACDFIPIGYQIQLCVKEAQRFQLFCQVVEGGQLNSRMPVLFPKKCSKYRMSYEEIEDITFCKEVGINVIVSYIHGSKRYLSDLRRCMSLLDCGNMLLCVRIVLNSLHGCTDEILWVADCYDGFLIELHQDCEKNSGELLEMCPATVNFLKRIYELKKPILFEPSQIANKFYIVGTEYSEYIFYYPDKYIIKSGEECFLNYFHMLHRPMFKRVAREILCQEPFTDESDFGGDTLARNCAIASFESDIAAILVCSPAGRLAIDISHFRPNVPILLITKTRSIGKYISIFHRITMYYYPGDPTQTYYNEVYKQFLLGIVYVLSRRIMQKGQTLMLVYDSLPDRNYGDKYAMFKVTSNFMNQLRNLLFI